MLFKYSYYAYANLYVMMSLPREDFQRDITHISSSTQDIDTTYNLKS